MRIAPINFGNKIVDFETARNQRKETTPKTPSKTEKQVDSFTKSTPTEANIAGSISDIGYTKKLPMEKGISPGVEYFRATDPAVDDPTDAIFYSSQFNLLSDLMQEKDEYKITPEDAAKELIRILKTGEPAKAIANALDEDYQKADAFFSAYYHLIQTLDKDVKTRNLMAAIEIISEPIESMSDEFMDELEDNEDESDADFDEIEEALDLDNQQRYHSGLMSTQESQDFSKKLDKTLIDIASMKDGASVGVSFKVSKDFNPEKVKETFGILVDRLADLQRKFKAGILKQPLTEEQSGDSFIPSDDSKKED